MGPAAYGTALGLGRRTRKENVVAKRSLVVVESPTKVKTIQKYLNSSFIVKASMGQVRDQTKSELGGDPKRGFKPKYVVSPGKKKVLDELKKAATKTDTLYVATDPDREGEAIGWHLAQELDVDKKNVYRISCNEITESAVKAAFAKPGRIDLRKVDAQQARRVLDRLVGYSLSPLLWDKVQRGLSAGRVQSVAVRLVVDRERGIRAKKTMTIAQQLYEGVDVGTEGPVGLITYMRTDSVRVAREAQEEARGWIVGRLGRDYVPDAPPAYRSRGSAQEAHEAVRPSDVRREPKDVTRFLSPEQLALYRLIWERFLASQMMPAVYDTLTVDIEAGRCLFRAQGSTLRFKGFTAVYEESREDEVASAEEDPEGAIPNLEEGEVLRLRVLEPKQHFTQPPPRYTEASLIKALVELGSRRPSTYSSILS